MSIETQFPQAVANVLADSTFVRPALAIALPKGTEQHQFVAGPFAFAASLPFSGSTNIAATFFTNSASLQWADAVTLGFGWRARYSVTFECEPTQPGNLDTVLTCVCSFQKATGVLPPPTAQQFAQDQHNSIGIRSISATAPGFQLYSQSGAVDISTPGGPAANGDPLSVGVFIATGATSGVTIRNIEFSVVLLPGVSS